MKWSNMVAVVCAVILIMAIMLIPRALKERKPKMEMESTYIDVGYAKNRTPGFPHIIPPPEKEKGNETQIRERASRVER